MQIYCGTDIIEVIFNIFSILFFISLRFPRVHAAVTVGRVLIANP